LIIEWWVSKSSSDVIAWTIGPSSCFFLITSMFHNTFTKASYFSSIKKLCYVYDGF
jgi:hypothetical protein